MIYNRCIALTAIFIDLFGLTAFGAGDQSLSKSDRIANLNTARPLNHHVHVTRMGGALKLDYQLIGSDGKKHSLWDIHDQSKPTFSIYHNGNQVGGGVFEFG